VGSEEGYVEGICVLKYWMAKMLEEMRPNPLKKATSSERVSL
jgi:hypothetical protein